MENICTHGKAYTLLHGGTFLDGLKIAGPILEQNPKDIIAWYLCALGLYKLNKQSDGLSQAANGLKNAAHSLAKSGQPMLAIEAAKEIQSSNNQKFVVEIYDQIAQNYANHANQLKKNAFPFAPIPSEHIYPWQESLSKEDTIQMTSSLCGIAWGDSLTSHPPVNLPYLPILSALPKTECMELLAAIEIRYFQAGETIISQGTHSSSLYFVATGAVRITRSLRSTHNVFPLRMLCQGACFGEQALVTQLPASDSVVATENTTLFAIPAQTIERVAQKQPILAQTLVAFAVTRQLKYLLVTHSLFQSIHFTNRLAIISQCKTEIFEAGDIIVRAETPMSDIFLMVSGEVGIEHITSTSAKIIPLPYELDTIGVDSCLQNRRSNHTFVAIQNTTVLKLSQNQFRAIIGSNPLLLGESYAIAMECEKLKNSA